MFTARYRLTRWDEHVRLLPGRVLGQWFCVERAGGKPLWERRYRRPNMVVDVSDGIVVATEARSDGPSAGNLGCYGISMETGELLWVSHGNGLWGHALRCLDYLPGFANEMRDVPMHVDGQECMCGSGRVLDVRTGRQVRRVTCEQIKSRNQPSNEVQDDTYVLHAEGKVAIAPGVWLMHGDSGVRNLGGLRLQLLNEDDTIRWSFDINAAGYHISHCHFYAYRYAKQYVYVVASEEPSMKPDPTQEYHVVDNPTHFHLLTIETSSGVVVQDIQLGSRRYRECRIEDIDEHGLLVAADNRDLWYFSRNQR
jgi:hypothetical protein